MPVPVAAHPVRRFRAPGRVLLAACLSACTVTDPFTSTNELPENPGTVVAAAGAVRDASALVWSADGRQLHYETATGSLATLDVGSGAVTVRDGPRDEHAELGSARAGGAVYYLADRAGPTRSAYRLPAGGPEALLTDRAPASGPIVPGDGVLVLGGPGDAAVAFVVAPDSLFLRTNATGERRFVAAGCARIAAFSPDGGRLLCKRVTQGTFGVFDAAAGTVQTVSLQPAERESQLLRTRWSEPDSIHSLYRTVTRFRERAASTGNAYSIWIPVFFGGVRETDFRNWSWSQDGSRFVFWIHECLKLDRVGGCDFGQSVLYAVATGSNTGAPVAVVKGTRGAEQVAVSPDGRRVAFVFNGQLHLQDIP